MTKRSIASDVQTIRTRLMCGRESVTSRGSPRGQRLRVRRRHGGADSEAQAGDLAGLSKAWKAVAGRGWGGRRLRRGSSRRRPVELEPAVCPGAGPFFGQQAQQDPSARPIRGAPQQSRVVGHIAVVNVLVHRPVHDRPFGMRATPSWMNARGTLSSDGRRQFRRRWVRRGSRLLRV